MKKLLQTINPLLPEAGHLNDSQEHVANLFFQQNDVVVLKVPTLESAQHADKASNVFACNSVDIRPNVCSKCTMDGVSICIEEEYQRQKCREN